MKLPLYWEGLVYGKAMGWINLGKAGGSRMREFATEKILGAGVREVASSSY